MTTKESQRTEWKVSWRDEYLKWVCGFANADGGLLVIGRDDAGEVVGVDDARRLLVELPNKVRDLLGLMVDVNLRRKAGREYVEIRVPPYPNPISLRGEYYYRSGSTNQMLKGAALDRFLLRKQGKHWDAVPVPGVGAKNLSAGAVDAFRKGARASKRLSSVDLRGSVASLLDRLRLTDGKRLKRAAVLLFHPEPERFVTGAFIKIGFFRTDADLLYHDEVHGDLFSQTDRTMDLLTTKYLRAGISYRGVQRVETLPVPEAALREAVLNAVVHKDYARGTPIQISVYGDKLMLWNPGELPDRWTVAKLETKHASIPFNPDVANTFFRAGKIEAWGTGVERMMDACRDAGTPRPRIQHGSAELLLEFPFPAGYGVVATTQETTQERILALLRLEPALTGNRLAERIGLSANGVKYHLGKLRQAGRIRHVGASKKGHWEVDDGNR